MKFTYLTQLTRSRMPVISITSHNKIAQNFNGWQMPVGDNMFISQGQIRAIDSLLLDPKC